MLTMVATLNAKVLSNDAKWREGRGFVAAGREPENGSMFRLLFLVLPLEWRGVRRGGRTDVGGGCVTGVQLKRRESTVVIRKTFRQGWAPATKESINQ